MHGLRFVPSRRLHCPILAGCKRRLSNSAANNKNRVKTIDIMRKYKWTMDELAAPSGDYYQIYSKTSSKYLKQAAIAGCFLALTFGY
ncbi:MAG: hypothetical protein MHPSP_004079, partial [Paramarteilia canceri]